LKPAGKFSQSTFSAAGNGEHAVSKNTTNEQHLMPRSF